VPRWVTVVTSYSTLGPVSSVGEYLKYYFKYMSSILYLYFKYFSPEVFVLVSKIRLHEYLVF